MMRSLLCSLFVLCSVPSFAQRVLIVTAHPDDESGCAATVYKISKELGGTVDLAVITNGEAGYKYASLAGAVYGFDLTNEEVGRRELPSIRKRELMAGGKWIGIRNYFFFDQTDNHYTLDADTVMKQVWDVEWVKHRLTEIMIEGGYDFIFTMLPTDETHGHHKAAGIIALQTLSDLRIRSRRPVILGMGGGRKDAAKPYTELAGYPVTKVDPGVPVFEFDKLQKFGYNGKLDYRIPVNWLISEHKSQGVMQTYMNMGEKEYFYFFAMNSPDEVERVKTLFDRLNAPPNGSKGNRP